MSGVESLDHVGIVARDLATVATQFEQLGFTLTPFARQSDGRIGNRCAMLHNGYIELLAAVNGSAGSMTIERFLARYAGIHILAFAFSDEASALIRLHRAGVNVSGSARYERSMDDADRNGPRARFAVIAMPDQPEGRINLVQHFTRELLWQERFLRHPNSATALREVILAVTEPADTAARFSRLLGSVVAPDRAGGFALYLQKTRIRLLSELAIHSLFPLIEIPTLPYIAGITVSTSDENAAVERLLIERKIQYRATGEALVVDSAHAGGVTVRFLATG